MKYGKFVMMKYAAVGWFLLVAFLFGCEDRHEHKATSGKNAESDVKRITAWIEQLDSDDLSKYEEAKKELILNGGMALKPLLRARTGKNHARIHRIEDVVNVLRKKICFAATRDAIQIEIERAKKQIAEYELAITQPANHHLRKKLYRAIQNEKAKLGELRQQAVRYAKMTPTEYVLPTPRTLHLMQKENMNAPILEKWELGEGLFAWKTPSDKSWLMQHIGMSRSGPFYKMIASATPSCPSTARVYPLMCSTYSFPEYYVYVEPVYEREADSSKGNNENVAQCVPSTTPEPEDRALAELSNFLPFVVGTEYVYQVYSRRAKPQSRHLRCVDFASVGSERLGLFSVQQAGKERSGMAILETPPIFWFISIPDLSTREKNQAQVILRKFGPSLRKAKDIPDVKDKSGILGLLRPNPSVKNTIRGEFALLQAMHFGHHPFGQASVIPEKKLRWLTRGGNAYLQKGIGLLELSTWDQTCHGNGMSLYLVGYHPENPDWALPVDVSRNGQYRHGKWEYQIDLIPRSEGKPIRKGTFLSWPHDSRWVLPGTGPIVTPWGIFMRNAGPDDVGWLPIAEKENP